MIVLFVGFGRGWEGFRFELLVVVCHFRLEELLTFL